MEMRRVVADVSPFDGEGDLHDPPYGYDHPDVEVCEECNDLVEIVEQGVETAGQLETERDYWVVKLQCGHERSWPWPPRKRQE